MGSDCSLAGQPVPLPLERPIHFLDDLAQIHGVPAGPGITRHRRLNVAVLHQRGHVVRADFLIELRCALWVSPPNITAFVLPAL